MIGGPSLIYYLDTLGGFFDTRADQVEDRCFALDMVAGDEEILHLLIARQDVHRLEKDFFHDHHQSTRSDLSFVSLLRDRRQRIVGEFETDVVELELPLILLHKRIFRLGQDLDQRGLVEFLQRSNNRKAADEFRNKTVVDQILRLKTIYRLGLPLRFRFHLCLEAERFVSHALADDLFQSDESTAANEKNVRRVELCEFLLRVFASAAGWDIRSR